MMTPEQTKQEIRNLIESIASAASDEKSMSICDVVVAEKIKDRIQTVLGKRA